ncbi:hypothetical protein F4810DRAFT_671548 [Camillea tinctor]|nr:hypothetical protein F4810DRAFT_671548 [Camillea tinctor]
MFCVNLFACLYTIVSTKALLIRLVGSWISPKMPIWFVCSGCIDHPRSITHQRTCECIVIYAFCTLPVCVLISYLLPYHKT